MRRRHAATCAIVLLAGLTAACERPGLVGEAERQLDAAEARINEIGKVYKAGYEQQLVRLERAPDCIPNDYYCPEYRESAENEAELLAG